MNWDYPKPFTHEIIVQANDIDGMGHANNACYVVWCESCAWKHSESLGLSITDYQKLDRGVAINQARYDYVLPSFEGDKLIIATWLTGCDGKLRLERSFQIIHSESRQTILREYWQMICVSVSTGKPIRLPDQFLSIYGDAVISS